MACGCSVSRNVAFDDIKGIQLHEVLPGESCIFCACKHIATAYSSCMSAGPVPLQIGELELARRHALAEFGDVAQLVAQALAMALVGEREELASNIAKAFDAASAAAASTDPDTRTTVQSYAAGSMMDAPNPFIGALHLYAAYRLASEVGYMRLNKAMIVGDLALAREHLCRFDPSMQAKFRELRHRVQVTNAADINIYWPYVASVVHRKLEPMLKDDAELYEDGLRDYLGLSKEQ